jgi:hypothetical protein
MAQEVGAPPLRTKVQRVVFFLAGLACFIVAAFGAAFVLLYILSALLPFMLVAVVLLLVSAVGSVALVVAGSLVGRNGQPWTLRPSRRTAVSVALVSAILLLVCGTLYVLAGARG